MSTNDSMLKPISRVFIGAALLLIIPLIGTRTVDGWVWTATDFTAAFVLLSGAGLMYVALSRRVGTTVYKIASAVAVFSVLFLIWSNLAVGLIGSEDNSINALYLAVVVVGLLGATIARARPTGMVVTLACMAAVQASITGYALATGQQNAPGSSVTEILGVNAFFVTLYVISALLYRQASAPRADAK